MTFYLSAGARYIQEWLAATPRLRLMRGASKALVERTSAATVAGWLKEASSDTAVKPCDEAGDVAGVVVLKADQASALESLAPQLLNHLDRELPGLHWSGWLRSANSYVQAYADQAAWESGAGDEPLLELTSIPDLAEHGFLRSCPGCGAEPAGAGTERGRPDLDADEEDLQRWYGTGCTVRYTVGTRATSGGRFSLARDFEGLATRGGMGDRRGPADSDRRAVGRGASRSHLALVTADGNRFGEVFKTLAKGGPALQSFRAVVSADIDTRFSDAVGRAGEAVAPASDVTPSSSDYVVAPWEPHYVGGDDLLVSVPAVFAWRYVEALLREFDQLRKDLLSKFGKLVGDQSSDEDVKSVEKTIEGVSLGVGLVFAHRTHPFSQTWEVGHDALAKAKKDTGGRSSAVTFVDLTVDGSGRVRHTVTWKELKPELEDSSQSPGILRLSGSARAHLSQALREDGAPDDRAVLLHIERERKRWGITEPLINVLNGDSASPDVESEEPGRLAERLAAVAGLLDRARWWPEDLQTLARDR